MLIRKVKKVLAKNMLKNEVLALISIALISIAFLIFFSVLFLKLLQLPICERVWFCVNPKAKMERCISNLRIIEAAKDQYCIENGLTNGTIVTKEQINKYILMGGFERLFCPSGGKYQINPFGSNATCSIPSHKLCTTGE